MLKIAKTLFFAVLLATAFGTVKAGNGETDSCKVSRTDQLLNDPNPCVQMYGLLFKYSQKYNVPVGIIYGVAHKESGYQGPLHDAYNPKRTGHLSYGAMQLKVGTANWVWGTKNVTKKKLLNDLDFNVETSVKLLSMLKQTHGTWGKALGAYNTGRPIVNKYSREILNGQSKFNLYGGLL
jgi:hypothetical protein